MARGHRTHITSTSRTRAQITPGARRCATVPLDTLLGDTPATVTIGDVHSDIDGLQRTLRRLGLVDATGARCDGGRHRLISVGDLIDGRDPRDLETLEYGERVFDRIICGNHEAALMGGPRFSGLLMPDPEVALVLNRLARTEQLTVAEVAHGTLITHAGVSSAWFDDEPAGEIHERLLDSWFAFLSNRDDQDGRLFAIDARRSRTGGADGGALWGDWRTLVGSGRPSFAQIVGHSAVGAPEETEHGAVICIDVAGDTIAAAATEPGGATRVGLDPAA